MIVIEVLYRCRKKAKQKGKTVGYRSNVRIMTDHDGFDAMCNIAWELAHERSISGNMVLFPNPDDTDKSKQFGYYDDGGDYVCFGFDWYKWYDDYYDEVILVMDALKKADEQGVAWQFLRTGEDYDDIEELNSDTFYSTNLNPMYIHVDITY